MLEYGFDKRVGFKGTTHFFKVRLCLFAIAIYAKTGLAVEVDISDEERMKQEMEALQQQEAENVIERQIENEDGK